MEIQSDQELLISILSTCTVNEIHDAMFEIGQKDIDRLIVIKIYLNVAYRQLTKREL